MNNRNNVDGAATATADRSAAGAITHREDDFHVTTGRFLASAYVEAVAKNYQGKTGGKW